MNLVLTLCSTIMSLCQVIPQMYIYIYIYIIYIYIYIYIYKCHVFIVYTCINYSSSYLGLENTVEKNLYLKSTLI